jgi:hypothetical protein
MVADPNYADIIHMQKLRVLIIRDDFQGHTSAQLADVVMFVKQGLVSILKSNYGPPGLTLPLQRLNLYTLLRSVGSSEVTILPASTTNTSAAIGGIFAIEANDPSGVHSVNLDNEANNTDFINRK